METVTIAVLLFASVAALCAVAVVLALRHGRTDAGMLTVLNKMADRVIVDHKEQIERMRRENELELGLDYNRTERERARFRGTEPAENGALKRPSIVVEDETG